MRVGLWAALAGVLVTACDDPVAVGGSTRGPADGSTGTFDDTTGELTTNASSTGESCAEPLLQCGDACVDPQWDPDHCGACDLECAEAELCVAGFCELVCGPGTTQCDGTCVDIEVDPAHCGECSHACPEGAACFEGGCVLDCADAETQCAEACVDLARDEAHCGNCDTVCDQDVPCVFGECVDAAVHHILVTGQSLSVGQQSVVVSTEQPFDNLMFANGVRSDPGDLTALAPLVEAQDGIFGETIASGTANMLSSLTAGDQSPGMRVMVSVHGVSSASYAELAKGSTPYTTGMAHAVAGASLVGDLGDSYLVRAVAALHGERDHVEGNAGYAANLVEWQSDYEADLQALGGHQHPVPLFVCQMSSWTHYGSATSLIPDAQLEATRMAPDRVFLVAPRYFLPYVDGLHLTGDGERRLGEYYAKAMKRVLVDGERWVPVAPREVVRTGVFIDIAFDVPVPPLVFDVDAVSDPGNYGFEYTDSSGNPPEIFDVAITGDDRVRVTLASEPTATDGRIRYAYTATPFEPSGPETGARGNLRDSDATVGLHGYPLHNWAVTFDEPL